jgi:tRNA(Ile)-lysidine synthase
VRDPSNDNVEFDRVAMRHWLEKSDHPFDIGRINRSVRALSEAADALSWVAAGIAAERIKENGDEIQCNSHNLPPEIKRRLLLHCLSRLEPDLKPRGEAIDRMLADLGAGKTSMIGNILCKGGAEWTFSVAPPRRADH